MATHPSDDIAGNIDTYFAVPTVEDGAKQAKLNSLETTAQGLANQVVADVCACADRAVALQRLRESFDLCVSALVNEPLNDSPDWPPV